MLLPINEKHFGVILIVIYVKKEFLWMSRVPKTYLKVSSSYFEICLAQVTVCKHQLSNEERVHTDILKNKYNN